MKALGEEQLSVKAMMERIGLKDRENFLDYSLNPSMNEGYVRMLYPESPRHPRQKYLLTVKGLALYNDISHVAQPNRIFQCVFFWKSALFYPSVAGVGEEEIPQLTFC